MPLEFLSYESIDDLILFIITYRKINKTYKKTKGYFNSTPSKISKDQQGLLLENNKNGMGLYNVYTLYELDGCIDISHLKIKIQKMVDLYDVLRYRIFEDGSFIIKKEQTYSWHELGCHTDTVCYDQELIALINKPFNLDMDPPLRVGLINLETVNKKIIVFILPHLLFDGASQSILERSFVKILNDSDVGLSIFTPPYSDYLSYLESTSVLKKLINEKYWTKKLTNFPLLQLPYDNYQEDKLSNGKTHSFILNNKITKKIRDYCVKNKTTLQSGILTVLFGLLSQYSDSGDLAIGIVFNGRVDKKFNDLLGYAVNTNILRINTDNNETYSTLLEKLKIELTDSFKHQSFPYASIKNIINKSEGHNGVMVISGV